MGITRDNKSTKIVGFGGPILAYGNFNTTPPIITRSSDPLLATFAQGFDHLLLAGDILITGSLGAMVFFFERGRNWGRNWAKKTMISSFFNKKNML